jgi:hypothetical protein
VILAAPQRRRLRTGGRRRRERPHRPEQRADHPFGRPVQHRDRATRPADSNQLVGDSLVLGSEHRPDRRHDDVERVIREGQPLGVSLDPFQLDAGRFGSLSARLEQLRREIAGGDFGAALRGGDRRVAGAGGDIEDAHSGADPARIHEPRSERQQKGLDHRRIVAGGPNRAMPGLEL